MNHPDMPLRQVTVRHPAATLGVEGNSYQFPGETFRVLIGNPSPTALRCAPCTLMVLWLWDHVALTRAST